MKKEVLFFDISNLVFRTIYVADANGRADFMTTSEVYDYWRHLTIQSIMALVDKKQYDEVIIGYDARGGYWRHDVYPAYKANRKKGRDDSTLDFEDFLPELARFYDEFKEMFPVFTHLNIPAAEADDIAAVMAKESSIRGDKITLVSSDKDYHQLLQYEGVSIWDPIKRKMIKSLNPIGDLRVKCVMGDKGDNIFAVRPNTGPVRAAKMIDSGELDMIMDKYYKDESTLLEEEKELATKYIMNTTLIDFASIPVPMKNAILESHRSYTHGTVNQGAIIKWMSAHNMKTLASKFIGSGIQSLYTLQGKQQIEADDLF
jgi:5'-3' exonuclease